MDDLLKFMVKQFKMDEDALSWGVHDVNATIEQQHDNTDWIRNQYENELNRRISVGEASAPRLLLDDDDNEIEYSIDTVYDDDGNLLPPTAIACLSTDFTKDPCVNFYYPSGPYVPEEDEDEEEIKDERNVPRRMLSDIVFDGNSEIFGIFAPSPTVCIEKGVTIELYRLKLEPTRMEPDEYDDDAWDQMNVSTRVLKTAARSNHAINMFNLMNDAGLYLFADGLWVYKIRLVDESGKMSCFSPPSAIVKIEACDYDKKGL